MKDTFDVYEWNKNRYLNENKEPLSEGSLTNYYSNSNSEVQSFAKKIDGILQQLNPSEEQLEALVRLITDLADEYADERLNDYKEEV